MGFLAKLVIWMSFSEKLMSALATCNSSFVCKSAYDVLMRNYDSDLLMTAPGSADELPFQHVTSTGALSASQAIAHYDFPRASNQFKQLMKSQWKNGMMPHLIYGPSVTPSTKWIRKINNFLPGPGFWEIPDDMRGTTQYLTSGIAASPIHAETALRIFMLAPLDMSIGLRVFSVEALHFICEVFQPLMKWHRYLFTTRRVVNGKSPLLVIQHPWESSELPFPVWDSILYNVTQEADYKQIVASMQIPDEEVHSWREQYHVLGGKNLVNTTYFPTLYLIRCFAKHRYDEKSIADNCPFNVLDVGFNSILLRSTLAVSKMAEILVEEGSSICGKNEPDMAKDRAEIRSWIKLLSDGLKAPVDDEGLWERRGEFYYDRALTRSHNGISSDSLGLAMVTGFLPLYANKLSDSIAQDVPTRFSLAEKFLSPSEGLRFSCDVFPIAIYPCAQASSGRMPRLVSPYYNYLLQQGFSKNDFPGVAGFVRNKTLSLMCSASRTGSFVFSDMYDANTGDPLELLHSYHSTVSAASVMNTLLPAYTPLPNPDTPPINHTVTLVVMCIELVVAFAVGISCVIFSVYFIATRPPEGSLEQSNILSPDRGSSAAASADARKYQYANSEEALAESLLADEEEQEYQTFTASGSDSLAVGSGRMWGSTRDFFRSISPWSTSMTVHKTPRPHP